MKLNGKNKGRLISGILCSVNELCLFVFILSGKIKVRSFVGLLSRVNRLGYC